MNETVSKENGFEVETIFLVTDQEFSAINSSIVREIKKNGGKIGNFVTNEEFLIMSV
jgi:phosphopantetheine adenylyltransferase